MPWRSPPESLPTVEFDGDADAAEADHVDQDLPGDLLLLLDVDEAEAVGDLPADEEIAPQRLLLRQRLVLIDGLDREVVRHAHRILARLDFAVADEDLSGRRREDAGHHLDQGGLAGAVVADQADDLVASDGDVDVAERVDGAEMLLDALQTDDGRKVGGRGRHKCSSRRNSGDERRSSYDMKYAQLSGFGNGAGWRRKGAGSITVVKRAFSRTPFGPGPTAPPQSTTSSQCSSPSPSPATRRLGAMATSAITDASSSRRVTSTQAVASQSRTLLS